MRSDPDPEGTWTSSGIPDAPFKNTWHELGMKRAVQEAAAGGYDRLTWTTGKQQADRYALSHHVDQLVWDPSTKSLTGYKNGKHVFAEHVVEKDLPDYIGQEPAAKLLAAKPDLKVVEGKPKSMWSFSIKDHSEPAKKVSVPMYDI